MVQLIINASKNIFDVLKNLVAGNVDILVITKSKIDSTFLSSEFYIYGYAKPFRCDRNKNAGGVIIFIRGVIPGKELKKNFLNEYRRYVH